jgi:hypothetical protein
MAQPLIEQHTHALYVGVRAFDLAERFQREALAIRQEMGNGRGIAITAHDLRARPDREQHLGRGRDQ